ncbi:hypothetical protein RHO13_09450 [Orbus wheelerorum]|uniref:hypothetical protein n=1 Tax=Orbus wheelerorum TaxID=3074111 RepID=UPI00370D8147
MINKRLFWISLLSLSSLLLTACDNYPYKTDIQETYDWNNQSGDKAIYMIVDSLLSLIIKYKEQLCAV